MAIQAVDTSQVWDYICKREREVTEGPADEQHPADPNPTVWKLGVLDGRIMKYIKDAATGIEGTNGGSQTTVKLGSVLWLFVKYGLRGWSNWLDHAGQPITYSFDTIAHGKETYKVVPDGLLSLLPQDVLIELASEIVNHNTLKEAEKRPLGS